MRIAWIGLGTMGAPMAGHLLAAGHELHVHNRTRSREEPLAAAGAIRAETPAEAALGAELVFTCVSDSPDLEAIVLGERGIAGAMRDGSVLVDCSTVSPATAKKIAATLTPMGIGAVDAPVSGGSEGARRGNAHRSSSAARTRTSRPRCRPSRSSRARSPISACRARGRRARPSTRC